MPDSFNQRLRVANATSGGLLCVGLDPDPNRMPAHLPRDIGGVEYFLDSVVAATSQWASAYKPNWAFFLALGPAGIELLAGLRQRIPTGRLLIGDGKWGDIGNTTDRFAQARDAFGLDAVTATPYMGWDAIAGLCRQSDRGVFVVCRSSNPSGGRIQSISDGGDPLFLQIAREVAANNDLDNCGLVLGATDPDDLGSARRAAPGTSTLIPGIGPQGGELARVLANLPEGDRFGGTLINAGRAVLYAANGHEFAAAAGRAAAELGERINEARESL